MILFLLTAAAHYGIGIAVDPQLRLIFFTDECAGTISVVNYAGTDRRTIAPSLDRPRDVAVDLTKR